MSKLKFLARFAAAAILATGVFAASAPADAAATHTSHHPVVKPLDTGWGS
ncbi:MAG: hypothetical protein JWP74_1882 [Marmoricola sp.]|nr:hypothetical protein [Marmoricola sp.]